MVVFYDVLLVDDDPILTKPQHSRRKQLEQLVTRISGRAELVMREEVYFSSPEGSKRLLHAFGSGIRQRWEGFVLKPCDEPYFSMMDSPQQHYSGCWIKLKKDYIQGLGDTADFAVVGACYDSNAAKATGIKNLSWTHFHVALLCNKEDVLRFDAKPIFKVVDAVNQCIKREDLQTLNQLGQFRCRPYNASGDIGEFNLSMPPGLIPKMDVVFHAPFVFEVMGSGFDKPKNANYFTLRFPRVLKIHWDRTFKEAISLSEFELMVEQARSVPPDTSSQDDAAWIVKLEQADRGKSGNLARWEGSQTPLCSTDNSAISQIQSSASKRTKAIASPPFVRVDTVEMLVGESRSAMNEAALNTNRCYPRSALMTLPTPPASSPEVEQGMYIKPSAACDAGISGESSRKRTADNTDKADEGRSPKQRKSFVPALPITLSQSASSTKYISSKAPLSEITNTSLRRKASPPPRAMKKAPGPPDVTCPDDHTKPQTLVNQAGSTATNILLAPNPTSSDQAPPTSRTPASPSTPPSECADSTVGTPSPRLPVAFSTSTAPKSHDTSLRNTVVLLSPCINMMPYITENLLGPYNVTIFKDFIAFIAHANPAPASIPKHPPSANTIAAPQTQTKRPKKVVLVESHRPEATAWLIREIWRVDIHQDIEFFDWRVLEDVESLEEGTEAWKAAWRERFKARIRWDWEEMAGKVEWDYDE